MTDHDDLFDVVPLYSLDALDREEAERLEAHIAACPTCAAELARLREVAAALVPDGPAPPGVWERIRHEIDHAAAFTPLPGRHDRTLIWIASAAAVLAVVLGVVTLIQRQAIERLEGAEGIIAAAEEAARQPGSVVTELATDTGPVARVVVTSEGEGFLVPIELAPLGPERTYQLWVITPDELVISAGVLGSDPKPSRFTWSGEIAGFALTREAAGGVVSSAGDVVAVAET